MTDLVSPDVIVMLALAFGFAALVLGGDWLLKRLAGSPIHPAE